MALTSGIEELILKFNPSLRIYKVFNPVEIYKGKLIPRPSFPTFLYVGRIEEKQAKNLSFMLKGLSRIKNREWQLIIVGEGRDKIKLQKYAQKLRINDKIEWRGFTKKPYDNLEKGVSALLLTSRWEGLPLVVLESNARGIPAIISSFPGSTDIVFNGRNGFIFQEGDLSGFVEILNKIIEGKLSFDSPEEISKTVERFESSKILENIEKIIEEELS